MSPDGYTGDINDEREAQYEPLFSILDGMSQDVDRRFCIERLDASEDNCDIEEDMEQMNTDVKIALQMSRNILTRTDEYVK
jgi:hypothetical protein